MKINTVLKNVKKDKFLVFQQINVKLLVNLQNLLTKNIIFVKNVSQALRKDVNNAQNKLVFIV